MLRVTWEDYVVETRLWYLDSQFKGAFWPLVTFLVVVIMFGFGGQVDAMYSFNPAVFPVLAVDWLKEDLQDRKMLNDFFWESLYKLP